jgi:4-hydroxyphenylacetate decarboxylase small subunit
MSGVTKHMDCRNFAAIDAAKGICHRTKEVVAADGDHCEHCVPIQKCKFCLHFTSTEQYLGTCNAVASKPMTYPDLIAVTCEMFAAADTAGRS